VSRFVEHIDVASVLTAGRLARRVHPTGCARAWASAEAKAAVLGCNMSGWFVTDGDERLVGQLDRDALTPRRAG
jgi:glycine betaine/proline transport system ATP-binding protein